MKKLITLLLLFTFSLVKSQSPTWQWATSGDGYGYGYATTSDISKNAYLAGSYTDSISFGGQVLSDSNQVYLVKYDSLGSVRWVRTSRGNSGTKAAYSLTADAFSNIYMTGLFTGDSITFGTHTLHSPGANASNFLFLVKYNAAGNVVWAKNAGGAAGQNVTSLSTDLAGHIYIAGGFTSSSIIFGTDTLINSGSADIFLAKYDSSGNAVWAKKTGGNLFDWVFGISTDQNGNIYMTGEYASTFITFAPYILTNPGGISYFIAKYDSLGVVRWAKKQDRALGFAVCSNSISDVYVTGAFHTSTITFGSYTLTNTSTVTGGSELFLVKYSSLGNVIWAKTVVDSNFCKPASLSVDILDNVYFIGRMLITSITFDGITLQVPPASCEPMYVVKYDTNGHAVWAAALTNGGDDHNSISVDYSGDIYIGGSFICSPFVVGNDTLISTNSSSPFITKLIPPVPLGVISNNNNSFESAIYPNPFVNSFTVEVNNNELSQITLFDILSKKILQQNFTNSTIVTTEKLTPGVYLYQLRNKYGVTKNGKLIKQ